MKTVYIIHGWDGSPEEPLHKWLKAELEGRGYTVVAPLMPNSAEPVIESWVAKLKELVTEPNNAILVGHSIGCQAILRYLEGLGSKEKVAGVVFIAPWFTLTLGDEESQEVAEPWLTTTIDDSAVQKHVSTITAIFSDDDPYVPMENVEFFKHRLGADVILEHGRGHFTADDGAANLQSALDTILKI